MRTRPHDTFSCFAILACPYLVPLRHDVGSLELKVYLSLIFGYVVIFFSVEESHLSLPQYVLATAVAVLCAAISGGTLHLTVECSVVT